MKEKPSAATLQALKGACVRKWFSTGWFNGKAVVVLLPSSCIPQRFPIRLNINFTAPSRSRNRQEGRSHGHSVANIRE